MTTRRRRIPNREFADGSTGYGSVNLSDDEESAKNGPGREDLRVMAHNALSQAERRELVDDGTMESYLDGMADGVASQARNYKSQGYTWDRAWVYAVRLVIHGREPD